MASGGSMGSGLSGGRRRRNSTISDINVTPLVDVMLVLLAIFMVTATYIVKQSIDIDLPNAATGGESQTEKEPLAISLDAAGILHLGDKVTTWDTLGSALKTAKEQSGSTVAIVSADKIAKHGDVVRLIDILRSQGIEKLAINVLKPQ